MGSRQKAINKIKINGNNAPINCVAGTSNCLLAEIPNKMLFGNPSERSGNRSCGRIRKGKDGLRGWNGLKMEMS